MSRQVKRRRDRLRPLGITRDYLRGAPGSILFEMGGTRVVCSATVEDSVPPFLRGTGRGWVTAEYGMLPRSSPRRIARESLKGKVKGRTHEIQRLIGRALRASVDLEKLGERTVIIDCDVLDADGGTRTASVNGGFMALASTLRSMGLEKEALRGFVGAVSVGIVGGRPVLDLDYALDSTADVDMNVVMDEYGDYIEVQGTAEGATFTPDQLEAMLRSASRGIKRIIREQKRVLEWA